MHIQDLLTSFRKHQAADGLNPRNPRFPDSPDDSRPAILAQAKPGAETEGKMFKFMNKVIDRRAVIAATSSTFATAALAGHALAENAADQHWARVEHEAAENPELVRLAAELPLAVASHKEAADRVHQIELTWNPIWPLAPHEITLPAGRDLECDLSGRPIIRPGEERAWGVFSIAEIKELLGYAKSRRQSRRRRGRSEKAAAIRFWRQALKSGTAYHAETARIVAASGIEAARSDVIARRRAIAEIVDRTMHEEASTMAGLVIKAEAIQCWARYATIPGLMLSSALSGSGVRSLGTELAASILRITDGVSRGRAL